MEQKYILKLLLKELEQVDDQIINDVVYGAHLLGIGTEKFGLASWAYHQKISSDTEFPPMPLHKSARETARLLLSSNPFEASLGLACVNSLLKIDNIPHQKNIKAQDLIVRFGENKNVAVIGHFPFVNRIRHKFANFWVLEKRPCPGDIYENEAPTVLPKADVVAITATTLANNTLATILQLTSPHSLKIMLGPSTPLTPILFELGIDVLAGITVLDKEKVKQSISAGLPFKMVEGVQRVVWAR
ncbi:DUF364 domain-containing protein [Desulfohalobiaceae bacterium Ax17]|uniref:DUF364 domain-containing protein n=1 Tax=Desulfovulcanus ferrireducens TaxID=2831190 RepID=UPI00207BA7DA|nr:DUF364 domain-containing protein [Desulfovulcanus ferrireducens]MBT8763950.1 DUF364 domain-containing protein [Desulfovulcanus ferrireducens]